MMNRPVPSEVEAKLLAPREGAVRAIARAEQLGPYAIRPRDTAHLHSVYIDTPRLTLAQHGIALRLRRHARRWEATAKWAGQIEGDVHERPELTVALSRPPQIPFTLPVGPLQLHLTALVAGRPLAPILISDIRRQRFDVFATVSTGPIAELALDRVHLRAPASQKVSATYDEVEIELLEGERQEVETIARLLRQQFDLTPSTQSKFARGITLLYGHDPRGATPSTPIAIDDSLRDAARKVIRLHLGRLRQHDPGTRVGQDPEALHDMRVASRRLRAALRAFEGGIPQPLRTYLRNELKWLGGLLGGVRDLDVQLAALEHYRTSLPAPESQPLTGLHDYLGTERSRRRQEMLAGLDSRRYLRLLVRIEDFGGGHTRARARSAAADEPVVVHGRQAIRKAFRRLVKCGKGIGTTPTDQDLHALRIRAKRLRYLLEFLREVLDKPGRRLVKRMIRLQDLLGSHHDAVVAADSIRRYVEGAGAESSRETLLALGAFMGEQRRVADAARGSFQEEWQRFSRRRVRDDLDAALRRLRTRRSRTTPKFAPLRVPVAATGDP